MSRKFLNFQFLLIQKKAPQFSLNSLRGRKDIDFIGIAEEAMP